jgi:hypothetical protein
VVLAVYGLRQAQFLKAEAMGVVLAVSFFGNARPTMPCLCSGLIYTYTVLCSYCTYKYKQQHNLE